jgi:lysophospholipase L1-like esterase
MRCSEIASKTNKSLVCTTIAPCVFLIFLSVDAAANPRQPAQKREILSNEEEDVQTKHQPDFVVGSIGDSITAAFDARRPLSNREINWSTGERSARLVNSHVLRIRKVLAGKNVGSINLAKSGSKSPDVVKQAVKLARYRPDYVTVLVGANDVCAWPEQHEPALAAYEKDIRTILDTLVESNRDMKILLSAVPNMPLMYRIGAANSCQSKWNLLKICPALLGSDRTPEQRDAFASRWIDANEALLRVSAEFPRNVRFTASVAEPVFHFGHLSPYDCFHPNTQGQDLLAEKTWEDVDGERWFQNFGP